VIEREIETKGIWDEHFFSLFFDGGGCVCVFFGGELLLFFFLFFEGEHLLKLHKGILG